MSSKIEIGRSRRTRIAAVVAGAAVAFGGLAGVAAGPAQASTPACGNTSLGVSTTFTQGGAGHSWMALIFRNLTHSACTLRGYPGLDALNGAGHVLAHATRTSGGVGVHTITVPAGGYASAAVSWLNFNPVTSGPCTWSASIATTPPNTTHTVRRAVSVSVCELQIRPTVAGVPNYPGYAPAQLDWYLGSKVPSYRQGYYWHHAAAALHGGSATQWTYQINELNQLISLPDAMQTPTQHAEWLHDVRDLDRFFATPNLYL